MGRRYLTVGSRLEHLVVGGGAAALIASFLDFVGATVHFGFATYTASINAWHSWSSVGVLLVLAAVALWPLRLLGTVTLPALAIGWGNATAGAAGLGTLLITLRAFTTGRGGSAWSSEGGW